MNNKKSSKHSFKVYIKSRRYSRKVKITESGFRKNRLKQTLRRVFKQRTSITIHQSGEGTRKMNRNPNSRKFSNGCKRLRMNGLDRMNWKQRRTGFSLKMRRNDKTSKGRTWRCKRWKLWTSTFELTTLAARFQM